MQVGESPIPTTGAGGCGPFNSPVEDGFTIRPPVPSARTSPGPAWPAGPGSYPSHYFTREETEAQKWDWSCRVTSGRIGCSGIARLGQRLGS